MTKEEVIQAVGLFKPSTSTLVYDPSIWSYKSYNKTAFINAINNAVTYTTTLPLAQTKVIGGTIFKEDTQRMTIKIDWPEVAKIEILKPGKVVRVTFHAPSFTCGTRSYKQICRDGDTFDLRMAVAIALIKDKGLNLTPEGNEYYARHFLSYYNDFNKVVDRGIKAYEREQREKEMAEHRKEEIKKIKERRRAKNAAKRKKRKESACGMR